MSGTIRHLHSLIIPRRREGHVPARLLLKCCLRWIWESLLLSLSSGIKQGGENTRHFLFGASLTSQCVYRGTWGWRHQKLLNPEVLREGPGMTVPVTKRHPFHFVPRKLGEPVFDPSFTIRNELEVPSHGESSHKRSVLSFLPGSDNSHSWK